MLHILMVCSVAAFVFEKYVVFEGKFGLRCPPKYQTFVDLLIDSPMIFIVV